MDTGGGDAAGAAGFGGGAGADMSNRSPIELLFAAGGEVTGEADEKPPKSSPKLLLGCGMAFG